MGRRLLDNDYVPLSDETLCACGHLLQKHRAAVVIRRTGRVEGAERETSLRESGQVPTDDEARVVILCYECAASGKRRSPLVPRFRVNRCLFPVPA